MCKFLKNFWTNAIIGLQVQEYILACLKLSTNPKIVAQRALIAKFLEGGELKEFSREDFIQYVINYGRTLGYLDTSEVIKGIYRESGYYKNKDFSLESKTNFKGEET